jgi:hypothetical protein
MLENKYSGLYIRLAKTIELMQKKEGIKSINKSNSFKSLLRALDVSHT